MCIVHCIHCAQIDFKLSSVRRTQNNTFFIKAPYMYVPTYDVYCVYPAVITEMQYPQIHCQHNKNRTRPTDTMQINHV